MVTELNRDTFDAFVAEGMAVVDLFAEWCGPCRMMAPVVEELSGEFPEVKFGKLNVDEAEEIAVRYGVQYIPTLLFFRDGECTAKETGVKRKEDLASKLS